MIQKEKHPRVGVGVYIIRGKKILMGKRIGPHGTNTWSPPGGWLEFGESWEDCARRETLEEAGIQIKNLRLGSVTNDIPANKSEHVVTLHIIADYNLGQVKIAEPHKWECWGWFAWNDLPKPLFYPLLKLKKQKFDPFEKQYGVPKRKKS